MATNVASKASSAKKTDKVLALIQLKNLTKRSVDSQKGVLEAERAEEPVTHGSRRIISSQILQLPKPNQNQTEAGQDKSKNWELRSSLNPVPNPQSTETTKSVPQIFTTKCMCRTGLH